VAPGRYQILAVHASAREVRDTDWSQVVALYDQFVRLDPSPIVALNRAIAVAELDGPEVALATVDRLEDKLAGYPPTMRPAPTCCAGWAAVRSRARRTTKPSSWRATPPRPPT
jgi:predicted RNA polymerase sigma factor